MVLPRRQFLRRSAWGALALVPAVRGLAACAEFGRGGGTGAVAGGYGPLVRSPDVPELALPEGFRAKVLSRSGSPMGSGRVPGAFDGMATFPRGGERMRIVRNHEVTFPADRAAPLAERSYDRFGSGGTTTLELRIAPDGEPEMLGEWPSLSGTLTNCAGGPTPWGSWLSCEETVKGRRDAAGRATGYAQNHGYVFEVSAAADGPVDPVPLRAMGRFEHEAVAVDPASGVVYLTEDFNPSGFYRFLPATAGRLAEGGRLQALAVAGSPGYDTRTGQPKGVRLPVAWVDIEDPDPAGDYVGSSAVFEQGRQRGAATFARLEGCWEWEGGIYFDATTGGDVRAGQVWHYRPSGPDAGELALVLESPSAEVLNMPDNLCITPRGGLVICEDGPGTCYVRGVTSEGAVFDFLRNELNDAEFAGVCISPQGRTLFVNIQGASDPSDPARPSLTLAVWGPWERGIL